MNLGAYFEDNSGQFGCSSIIVNSGVYFVFAYKKQHCCLGMQTKIIISLFIFHFWVLVTNAERIHLTKNKKIGSLIFNYFYRHHRCRIFVSIKPAIGKSQLVASQLAHC